MNVFLHARFSVNYARYSGIISRDRGQSPPHPSQKRTGHEERAGGTHMRDCTEDSHSPLAARERSNVYEAAKTVNSSSKHFEVRNKTHRRL